MTTTRDENQSHEDRAQAEDKILKSAIIHAKVMMVDDEPILTELVRSFLDEAGYQDFVGVNDPEAALNLLTEKRPDVLLLDLMMPKVSGFDILERVQSDVELRHIPVIVMTSASDAVTKLRVLEMGATDFLEKPVDPSELVLRLRNTLAFKAHRDRTVYFDALTNLPNRRLFSSQLTSALRRSLKNESKCGLIQIDTNRLKQVNETLGHHVGDAIIRTIAQRIQASLVGIDALGNNTDGANSWSLARLGGAEFVALMPNLDRAEQAAAVARGIVSAMNRPIIIDDHELVVSPYIGIAIGPNDGDDPNVLLQHANSALSASKLQGKSTYCFYSTDLNARAMERLNTETELRRAVINDEFELYYQPKVDVNTNRIVGAEALIRWNHPTRGLISPNDFIPIAEEVGLIVDIGSWVLKKACAQAVRWRNEGISDCGVSVNISPPHFYDGRLLEDVQDTILETGLNPCMLTLEITESMMMHHSHENLLTLESLKMMGVRTSLDDFGTGFSSLTHLKRMRIDELKIDKSFVAGLPDDTESAGIVRAVLAMARSLGIDVTAEGVETEEQLAFLKGQDLQVYQGFLCSQPIPADRFAHLLHEEFTTAGITVAESDSVATVS
ncbi:MAG: EAL domain-containing protein [Burkholderiaceae bacterium]